MNNTFSYTRLDTFKQCPYKYKLIYLDNHRIKCDTLALEYGSLIHKVEENIGNQLIAHTPVNYEEHLNFFNDEINRLKNKYPVDFYQLDKSSRTYEQKSEYYKRFAIYRLEDRVKKEGLKVIACEKEFFLQYDEYLFHGFIDRIVESKGRYIVEDIKTYSEALPEHKLRNPLQFIVYSLALSSVSNNVICEYDLPLCNLIQPCIMSNVNLNDILREIERSDFPPRPSPLCHWCVFSGTYPNQPTEAKGLCPYFSKWTRENKTNDVNTQWRGIVADNEIVKNFKSLLDKQN